MTPEEREHWKKYAPKQHSAHYWRTKYKPKLHSQQYYLDKYVLGKEPKRKTASSDQRQSKGKYGLDSADWIVVLFLIALFFIGKFLYLSS